MKSIWFKQYTLDDLKGLQNQTMMEHLDIQIVQIGPNFLKGTMPVDHRTHQPFGLLHGGASVALAETLGSLGATMTLDPATHFCVGQEINANHVRGVASGRVVGTASPFHIGGTSQVWSIEIRNAEEQLVCISRLTMAVRPR